MPAHSPSSIPRNFVKNPRGNSPNLPRFPNTYAPKPSYYPNLNTQLRPPGAPPLPKLPTPPFTGGFRLPRIPGGGAIGDFLLNEFLFPEPVADGTIPEHLKPPEPPVETEPPSAPFQGGQSDGVIYAIRFSARAKMSYGDPLFSNSLMCWGPVKSIKWVLRPNAQAPGNWQVAVEIVFRGYWYPNNPLPMGPEQTVVHITNGNVGWSDINDPRLYDRKITLKRYDDQPDNSGYPPGSTPPSYSPPGIYIGGPITINYGSPLPPSPLPPSQPPQPTTRAPAPLPNSNPNNPTNPSPVPQPAPIGQPNRTPTGTPEPPPQPNPTTGPTPTPTNVPPAILRGPWSNPTPTSTSRPGYNPGFVPTFTPNPINPNPGFSPNPLPTGRPTPRITPTPSGQPFTPTGPARAPQPEPPKIDLTKSKSPEIDLTKTPQERDLEDIKRNTTPEKIKQATKEGFCEALKPGNCGAELQNNQNKNSNEQQPEITGNLTFTSCENTTTQYSYSGKGFLGISSQITALSQQVNKLSSILCDLELVSAIPDWWQVRLGADRPQMVVVFLKEGSKTYHELAIPHPTNTSAVTSIPISSYQKGNWQGMITCKDNSKFIVNASTKEEAQRVCNEAALLINPNMLETPVRVHISERQGQAVGSGKMIPKVAMYFATGQRDTMPTWRVSLKNLT